MPKATVADIRAAILKLVPKDGTTIGNKALRELIAEKLSAKVADDDYFEARDALVEKGKLVKGAGQGGSVRRVVDAVGPLVLSAPEKPAGADAPKAKKAEVTLAQAKQAKGEVQGRKSGHGPKIIAYRHDQKRKNNPDVGVVTPDNDPQQPRTQWAYDPHIDPALQFDPSRAQIEKLIDEAIASGNLEVMRATLEQLKKQAAPYLNWAGKTERMNRPGFCRQSSAV